LKKKKMLDLTGLEKLAEDRLSSLLEKK